MVAAGRAAAVDAGRSYAARPRHRMPHLRGGSGARSFLPQAGPLLLYREPSGPGIRVDSGVREGDEIAGPLRSADREADRRRRNRATRRTARGSRARSAEFPILGIAHQRPVSGRLLEHPDVRAGGIDTGFVERDICDAARWRTRGRAAACRRRVAAASGRRRRWLRSAAAPARVRSRRSLDCRCRGWRS